MTRAMLVLAITLGLGMAGCSADDASGPCLTAFRNAEPRAGAPYNASSLDDAIRDCGTVAAWTDAWSRVPDSHPSSRDALSFLRERCQAEELTSTELCLAVAAAG